LRIYVVKSEIKNPKSEIIMSTYISAEQGGFRFLPQGRMFIVESFQNGLHYGLSQEFRFIPDTVAAAVDPKSSGFPVVKHQRKSVVPF
jgi:hypothetical protein